jgi:outer membrane protein
MALTNRSDLKQFTHQQEAAHYAVGVARAGYLPTLSAFFNYNSYYNSTARDAVDNGTSTPTFEKVSFTEQVTNRNPNRSVGLRLTIPIFSQFTNKTAVTRAKMLQENARLNLDQINNTIYNDVLTGVQGAEAAQASYEAAKSQYESAKLAYDTQQARYEVGLSNIIQLTTAAQNFVQAESNLASARYTLLFQRILLDFYVGVLTPETILGN